MRSAPPRFVVVGVIKRKDKPVKVAVVFFILGVAQGVILCDWVREKQLNKAQQRLHTTILSGKKARKA